MVSLILFPSVSYQLHKFTCNQKSSSLVTFLSAGTDGIDGPTDVAGAIIDDCTLLGAIKMGLDADEYLKSNDSYSFFHVLNNGENFIKPGHTGTNVMDMQLLLIQP